MWNSQQLWYSLEQGYIPNCIPGSIAEDILNQVKSILREIIMEGMSEEEKIFNIYKWFGENVQYDNDHKDFNYSSDPDNLPSEVISAVQSHFIEGAIYDGLAVCLGYAKTYLLMLRVEGIEAKFNLARMPYMAETNSINSIAGAFHGYVLIYINGKWYYSDPQKSSAGANEDQISYAFICRPKNNTGGFYEVMNQELIAGTDNNFYKHLIFNGIKLFIDNKQELYSILQEFYDCASTNKLAIYYELTYNECYNDLINYDNRFDVVRVSGYGIYELIISFIY